ncbi:multicopper oxidase [Biscogniauxia sp. FL1348]|nr:multicopper oxidase [Biscogniauxia sp. FL1348]
MGYSPFSSVLLWGLVLLIRVVISSPILPFTNTTRRFELTLTWEKGAPDGFERDMFKINGQFPGPLLEINEGDDVVILVINESPYNTSIHYHGIEMLGTPWSDGVPGITQINIQPGCAFTHKWKATQHGSYFYHSHAESQVNDGLYGPIVIHPAPGTQSPYSAITDDPVSLAAIEQAEKSRIPMLLSDWRHITSDREWEISQESRIEHLCFDSILVNGKGNVNCVPPEKQPALMTPGQRALLSVVPGAQLTDKSCLPPEVLAAAITTPSALPVHLEKIPHDIFYECNPTEGSIDVVTITQQARETEKWIMLDLIGSFGLHTVQVSLDELPMWVIAADGNDLAPSRADSILITNGQRYTVLVRLAAPKRYTLRVSGISDPQILYGTSVIDFQVEAAGETTQVPGGGGNSTSSSVPFINERGANLTADVVYFAPAAARPLTQPSLPAAADATYKFTMLVDGNSNQWAFNATRRADTEDAATPLLFAPAAGRQDNHTVTVASVSWVDYVMQVPRGQPAHPVHAHGRHFYVVGQGDGAFPWASVAEAVQHAPPGSFNLVDPPLRDTYPTAASANGPTWLVIRRPSDNPGPWLLHCHIMSHLQGGMAVVIQDGTDAWPAVPREYLDYSCQAQY